MINIRKLESELSLQAGHQANQTGGGRFAGKGKGENLRAGPLDR